MNGREPFTATIKKRRDFLAAAGGKKFIAKTIVLQMKIRDADHPSGPEARVGFTVTKKLGNAVIRNRVRRRLREAAKRVAPALVKRKHDYVIIARTPAVECPFSDLVRDMEFAFSRITANKSVST